MHAREDEETPLTSPPVGRPPDGSPRLVLVLGGTRSGKSAWAEQLAIDRAAPVRYVATAPEHDGERIALHRARRPAGWETVAIADAPDLDAALADADGTTVLLDGLGAWIGGRLRLAGLLDDDGHGDDPAHAIDGAATLAAAEQAAAALAMAAAARPGLTIVVGEEAGMAPVAADRGTRRWVDLIGHAHQELAARADRVVLVVAGRAIELPDPTVASEPSSASGSVVDAMSSAAPGRILADPEPEPLVTPPEPDPDAAAPLPPAADPSVRPARRPHDGRLVPDGMLDFAVAVVDGDPPGWARQALQAGIATLTAYPDDELTATALAARHGREPDSVLPLAGAAEGFWRIALALRPRHAAVVVPGFSEAEAALRAVGARITHVPRTAKAQWALDPSAVPEECDLVVVGRPENPTGTLDPREAILRLRRPGRTVLVDETFADFVADGDPLADHRAGDDGPGELLVLRSLAATLSVPGLRCGYAIGSADAIAAIRDAGPPWGCATPALRLLEAYAERPDACARIAARTAAHRADLTARLQQLAGVQVWPSVTNFVLVRVPAGIDPVAGLRGHGIAVGSATGYVGLDERHARIAVRVPALHARLAVALAATISAAEHDD